MSTLRRLKTAVKVGCQAFKLSRNVPDLSLHDYWERHTYFCIGRSVVAHTYDGSTNDLWLCDRYLHWREAHAVKQKWEARFGPVAKHKIVKE